MKRLRAMLVGLAALAVILPAAAQKKEKKQEQKSATTLAAPKPTPEMEKLAKMMVGTWSGAEKHEPSPYEPTGGTGKGVFKVSLGPGGHSLVEQYDSRSTLGKFTGHGLTFWDPNAKVFRTVWCDNFTPGCVVSVGQWEGDNLVFLSEGEYEGQKSRLKMAYSAFTPQSYDFGVDMSVGNGPMARSLTIKYKRMKAQMTSAGPAK